MCATPSGAGSRGGARGLNTLPSCSAAANPLREAFTKGRKKKTLFLKTGEKKKGKG